MDELWRAAILNTRSYACLQAAVGQVLHYRPAGADYVEEEHRETRLSTIESLYRTFSGTDPVKPILLSDPGNSGDYYIIIVFHQPSLAHRCLYMFETVRGIASISTRELKDAIERQTGTSVAQQSLLYAGSEITSDMLEASGIGDRSVIHLYVKSVENKPGSYSVIVCEHAFDMDLQVHEDSSVEEIKSRVRGMKGLSEEGTDLRLTWGNQELADEKTLNDYGIHQQQHILLLTINRFGC